MNARILLIIALFAAAPARALDLRGIEFGGQISAAKAAGLHCSFQKCTGRMSVLDFEGNAFAMYDKSGITGFLFQSTPDRYGALRVALEAKFGKPTESSVTTKQNAFGAKVQAHYDIWADDHGGFLALDEYAKFTELNIIIGPLSKGKDVGI